LLDKKTGCDLILRLQGSGYYAQGMIEHQMVAVLINGKLVAEWELSKQWLAGIYEAVIPASLVTDGVIEVVFKISNAAAPADFGYSTDPRKLGMAVKELVIEPAQPGKKQ